MAFDLVLFGATSFVGQITARRLVERVGVDGDFRWAIAGRNPAKLHEVAERTGALVPEIIVDADDDATVAKMAEQTKLIVSTVGPYAKYGSGVVAACAETGTDYCDLTGEPHWMVRMIDAHQEAAQARPAGRASCTRAGLTQFRLTLGFCSCKTWRTINSENRPNGSN